MNNLAEIIAATNNPNNDIRMEAENKLLNARDNNPALFIRVCAQEFNQKNLSDLLRPKAAVLLKYTLLNFQDGPQKLWTSLDEETREFTKTNILATLIEPNDTIRRVAADLIAILFAMEFKLGWWGGLIPTLTQQTKNQDPEIKKSAILTLGKICDHFKIQKIEMDKDVVTQIIAGIYFGMQDSENNDIKLIAVKALTDSLIFVKEIFENQNIRREVFQLLINATTSDYRELKVSAFQCLIEFVKIYYEYMAEFYSLVWDATKEYIICNDNELAILSIEVWINVANEEKGFGDSGKESAFQNQNITPILPEVVKVLIPALMDNLLVEKKYDDEDEGGELNIISSTRNCLISIAEAIKDSFLEYAVQFIGEYLVAQTPVGLRAGLIVYSCMLDGPTPQALEEWLLKSIPTVSMLLADCNDKRVQAEAAVALEKTAEVIPDIFFSNDIWGIVYPRMIATIQEHPRISMHVTKFWHFIGEYIKKKQTKSPNAGLDLTEVIGALLMNAFRDLDKKYFLVIDQTLLAVMTLLLCTQKDDLKSKYVQELVEQFKKTAHVSPDKRELIQAGLLSCLQTLLHKYKFKDTDTVAEDIFNLIMDMFSAYGEVNPDGIFVLSALASALGHRFQIISSKVWPYVAEGFKRSNQPELFLASLNAIVEMADACPDDTKNYLNDIFSTLIGLLNEANFDKTIKLRIIMAIGDISLGCKNDILDYFQDLARMYEMAMNAAKTPANQDTPDMIEYLEQLRESVLDSYVCFFHVVSESPNSDLILETLPFVMDFLATTCTKEFNPTVDYVRSALGFIADLGLIHKRKVTQYVKTELSQNLVEIMENFKNTPQNAQILGYARDVLQQF